MQTYLLSKSNLFHVFCPQRADFLEKDREMENAHSVAASAGDTEVYIAFCSSETRMMPCSCILFGRLSLF